MIADNYLNVLAKIMREQENEFTKLSELYHIVDEELYSCLEKVQFPGSAELSRRLNQMLQFINGLILYPELANKEVICLYDQNTNGLIKYIKSQINTEDYSWIRNFKTQIPIIIMDSPDVKIDIISTSFTKVTITKNELKTLILESENNNVEIDKLIKFLVFKIPLKNINKCFLFDNINEQLTELYDELIVTKMYFTDSQKIKKYKCINTEDIFKNRVAIISLYDVYKYSVAPVTNYYFNIIKRTKKNINELTQDFIRNQSEELDKLNEEFNEKLKKYENDKKIVDDVLFKLEQEIKIIDEQIFIEFSRKNGILNEFLKNCIFSYLFSIPEGDYQEEKECIKRIVDYGYEYSDLLLSYSRALNLKKVNLPTYDKKIIKNWECAKMLLQFENEEDINDDIKSMISSLGKDRVTTAKEWYYWSLIHDDKEALRLSVQLGCDMANKKLYNEGKNDMQTVQFLASILYPDACMMVGSEAIYGGKPITSIKDKRLTYFKIDAAIGDNRGIQKIVDILYENVIWVYFSNIGEPIQKQDKDDEDLYLAVLNLCEMLVSQKYNSYNNRERIAIINFCLNRNLSEVHNILYNMGSDLAYYCKGYLSEYGLYDSVDLDKALRLYNYVDSEVIPAVINGKKRVISKIETREKNKEEEYDEENDYQGSYSSSTVSSSWCFITTAASCALNKGKDCDELNFLRKFRDEHIKVSKEGEELVKEYYNIAPKLIEKIDAEADANNIYANLWNLYIVPSVKEIEQGNWQKAQDIYVMMVVDLSKKYGVKINTEGYEKLYYDTLKRIGYEDNI